MSETNRTGSPVPDSPFQHARDVGLIDWLVDALFMTSELTNVCAHCLAQEVAKEVEHTLDELHQHTKEDEHGH